MHPSSASADLPRIANLAVLLRQNCFLFYAAFSAELRCTTAHVRRLPRRGRAGRAFEILLKHRVHGEAVPAMHPSSASADLPRIANLAVLLRQNCFFIALFPAELGGTTTGTAGRTVCKSCTAHHKKSPDRMAWGSWWSILHSTRTRTVYSRYCGRFHEPRRIR